MRHVCQDDCWYEESGYLWCHGCGEHHRPPVATEELVPCPVDGVLIIDVTNGETDG